jgi:hypothetical protein
MKHIDKTQLKSIFGGLPLAIQVCATDKLITPPLDTSDNVSKGLNQVLSGQGAANGFQGVDIGVMAGPYFIPIGANLCP